MDLANLDLTKAANEGAWINLTHPATFEVLPIRFKILGKDSDKCINLTDELRRKIVDDAKNNKSEEQRAEKAKEYGIELLVGCTVDWENVKLDNKDLEYTPENAKAIYKRFTWIKEQIDDAVSIRANFLKP